MTDEIKALVQELDCLHVWPQSVADHHADILTPRQIRMLYAVGVTATNAARTITEQAAEIRRLNDRESELHGQLMRMIDRWEAQQVEIQRLKIELYGVPIDRLTPAERSDKTLQDFFAGKLRLNNSCSSAGSDS